MQDAMYNPDSELPPRTRRIRTAQMVFLRVRGTTSAHAENTKCTPPNRSNKWNYLRARGEYTFTRFSKEILMELPPRTRRILL